MVNGEHREGIWNISYLGGFQVIDKAVEEVGSGERRFAATLRVIPLCVILFLLCGCTGRLESRTVTSPGQRFTVSLPISFVLLPRDQFTTYKSPDQLSDPREHSAYRDEAAGICIFLQDSPPQWAETRHVDILQVFEDLAKTREGFIRTLRKENVRRGDSVIHHYAFTRDKPQMATSSLYVFNAKGRFSSIAFYYRSADQDVTPVESRVLDSMNTD